MRTGYFTEHEEFIEDLEKYDEKLKHFYKGFQMLENSPEKGGMLMRGSLRYFEEFREKHGKDGDDGFGTSTDALENHRKPEIVSRFIHLGNLERPNYRSCRSKRSSRKRKREAVNLRGMSLGPT